MVIGQIGTGFLISILQSLKREKEEIAAQQAKLALDIANKTLPYFRNINTESLNTVCKIIKEDIDADAVSITDKIIELDRKTKRLNSSHAIIRKSAFALKKKPQ